MTNTSTHQHRFPGNTVAKECFNLAISLVVIPHRDGRYNHNVLLFFPPDQPHEPGLIRLIDSCCCSVCLWENISIDVLHCPTWLFSNNVIWPFCSIILGLVIWSKALDSLLRISLPRVLENASSGKRASCSKEEDSSPPLVLGKRARKTWEEDRKESSWTLLNAFTFLSNYFKHIFRI